MHEASVRNLRSVHRCPLVVLVMIGFLLLGMTCCRQTPRVRLSAYCLSGLQNKISSLEEHCIV